MRRTPPSRRPRPPGRGREAPRRLSRTLMRMRGAVGKLTAAASRAFRSIRAAGATVRRGRNAVVGQALRECRVVGTRHRGCCRRRRRSRCRRGVESPLVEHAAVPAMSAAATAAIDAFRRELCPRRVGVRRRSGGTAPSCAEQAPGSSPRPSPGSPLADSQTPPLRTLAPTPAVAYRARRRGCRRDR